MSRRDDLSAVRAYHFGRVSHEKGDQDADAGENGETNLCAGEA